MAEISKKLKLISSRGGVSEDIKLYNNRADIPTNKRISVSYSGGTAYAPVGSDDSSSWSKLVTGFGKVSKEIAGGYNVTCVLNAGKYTLFNSSYIDLDYAFRIFPIMMTGPDDFDLNSGFKAAMKSHRIPEGEYIFDSGITRYAKETPEGSRNPLFSISCSGGVAIDFSSDILTVTGDGTITVSILKPYGSGMNIMWIAGAYWEGTLPYDKNSPSYTSPQIPVPVGGVAKLKLTFSEYNLYTTPFNVLIRTTVNGTIRDSISSSITPSGTRVVVKSNGVNYAEGELVTLYWNITNISLDYRYPIDISFGNYL